MEVMLVCISGTGALTLEIGGRLFILVAGNLQDMVLSVRLTVMVISVRMYSTSVKATAAKI
jgi:hypothetical protein